MSTRHSIVLPLPTSPDTLTMASSCGTAARSARNAPDIGPLFLPHPAVERGAVHPQQLRRLADVAAREAQRRLDVAALPRLERVVQVEVGRALELPQRLLGDCPGFAARRE